MGPALLLAAALTAGQLQSLAPGMAPSVADRAARAYNRAAEKGLLRQPLLTVIDYHLPSSARRLWVVDPAGGKLLFDDYVAHGRGSGEVTATVFGDEPGSLRSSLGVFLTGDTYQGKNGYSLLLDGLEAGFNDHALERAIVLHGAWYVSEPFVKEHGRTGRSWGCPAVDSRIARQLIDTIKGGSLFIADYPDPGWLARSAFVGR